MARKQSCETFKAGDDFAVDYCITTRGSPGRQELNSGQRVQDWFHSKVNVAGLDREKFWAIALNNRCQPLGLLELFTGGVGFSAVDPMLVLRRLVAVPLCSAAVFLHNHPSNNPAPSVDDERLFKMLDDGCKAIGVRCLDHLIVTVEPGVWHSAREGTRHAR